MSEISSIITSTNQYPILLNLLGTLSDQDSRPKLRNLCRTDLYFLLRYALGRADIERQWLFERCREVEASPNGYLDLWAREHYKSTIITYGKTIQDILASHGDDPVFDREVTVGIFSHTRPIAKGFLRQIMREFESNEWLKHLFPDVLWENPKRSSPKWSEDDGIVVQRSSNPKESTVEAWGLVDGQPTSKHFFVRVYDDVVTKESVGSPEMMKKTTEAWELSLNLGVDGGKERYIGTRYHFNDTYKEIMARDAAIPRIYPATDNGQIDGEPVLLQREALIEKRRKQGPYTFGCQMMQDPKADKAQGFDLNWLKAWSAKDWSRMNLYILVDPASKKKKDNDYTTMQVIGLGEDENYYWVAGIRDRLNLTERGRTLMRLHRDFRPKAVGYEEYGLQADIEYINTLQEAENYRFDITQLGGKLAKEDRIRRLVPIMEDGRWYMPAMHQHKTYDGQVINVVQEFQDELEAFPVGAHDDLIDGAARITDDDLGAKFPDSNKEVKQKNRPTHANNRYNPHRMRSRA